MAQRLLNDPQQDGWERSDFPIVCETCLGPNPYVRMQRIEYGGTCHISGRPYTVFRWRPGNEARYKKTIVCQEVAKAKNVCQVCLLDLDYGLPVQVRDAALGITDEGLPESEVGKEYQLNEKAKSGQLDSSYSQQRPNDLLLQLQRTTPYYKRNRAPICSFFVKGECNRGAECPYRHEMPTTGELAEQNIRDRYYGTNDPVANKMLRRVAELPQLTPPEDQSITTLYVGGLLPSITEDDLKDQFYSFGEIKSIKKVDTRNCAFVTYTTREGAEKAAQELHNKLIIKGARCRLDWGRPHTQGSRERAGGEASASGVTAANIPPLPSSSAGAGPSSADPAFFAPPSTSGPAAYPSMDPSAMGSRSQDSRPSNSAPEDQPDSKRPRVLPPPAMPPPGGPPPGMGRPPGMPPPVPPFPMGPPPPGILPPPMPRPPGPMPPMGMPPPMGPPPTVFPRPPPGSR